MVRNKRSVESSFAKNSKQAISEKENTIHTKENFKIRSCRYTVQRIDEESNMERD